MNRPTATGTGRKFNGKYDLCTTSLAGNIYIYSVFKKDRQGYTLNPEF